MDFSCRTDFGWSGECAMSNELSYESRDGVGIITLSRPDARNAINAAMRDEFRRLAVQLQSDTSIRCLVIAGKGPSFCAGIDLSEFTSGTISDLAQRSTPDVMLDDGWALVSMFEWIPRLPYPSIAAIQGHAYGAGMQLALACDFRIVADNASMQLPEVEYGLIPDMGATYRLSRLIGDGRARELILLGTAIDSAAATYLGLANHVVPASELNEAATRLADRLAKKSPTAIAAARRCINDAWGDDDTRLRTALRAQAECLASSSFHDTQMRLTHKRAGS